MLGAKHNPASPISPLVTIPRLLLGGLDFWVNNHRKYGEIYDLNLGFGNLTICNHPEHADHVLRKNAANYSKEGSFWKTAKALMGEGIITSEGEQWRTQRRSIQPFFQPRMVETLTDSMLSAIDTSLDRLASRAQVQRGVPLNVTREIKDITIRILMATIFGEGILSVEEANEVGDAFEFLTNQIVIRTLTSKLPSWIPVPGEQRYQRSLRVIDAAMTKVIAHCQQEPSSSNLVSAIIASQPGITRRHLLDQIRTIFVAGYETTATGLIWSMDFVTQDDTVRRRMMEEIDSVLGTRRPTQHDIAKLRYTQMIFRESLRLYGTYFVPRVARRRDTIDGHDIPPGTLVILMMYTIHRHPEFWSSPEVFDPNHFAPEISESRHPMAWIPFGGGQRQCLAKYFAETEAALVMTRLFQRFQIRSTAARRASPQAFTVVRPAKDIWMTFTSK